MPENKYQNRIQGKEEDPEIVADRMMNKVLSDIRNDPEVEVRYSPQAVVEMEAGPPIMRMNRKQFLAARRKGLV